MMHDQPLKQSFHIFCLKNEKLQRFFHKMKNVQIYKYIYLLDDNQSIETLIDIHLVQIKQDDINKNDLNLS